MKIERAQQAPENGVRFPFRVDDLIELLKKRKKLGRLVLKARFTPSSTSFILLLYKISFDKGAENVFF